ncbi:MAG TPA: hypothetical protein VJS17_04535 [Pyrinomonadaceae bacterium]|nr:hypothetical protein [Pyrinomonadaceae bacterium]
MNVSDAFVFLERAVLLEQRAFGVGAQDGGVQAAEIVSTVNERDLRKQQNAKDDENDVLLLRN